MKPANVGLTMNQLAERNAELVTENEKLKQQVTAVLTENVGLKQFPDQIVSFIGKLGTSEIGSDTKGKIEIAASRVKTLATDACLAEVQAQAIRDALDMSSDYLDTDCVMDRLDISYEDAELRTAGAAELHDALVAIANESRQGAKS